MRLYIKVDMEGVTGVVSYSQVNPQEPEYRFGQEMFMSDVKALLSGIYVHGNHEVLIYDMHFYGRNIDLASIDPRARVVVGKPPLTENFCYGLEEGFDGLILLGFHSMADNRQGLLHHSYEEDTESIFINGRLVGEIGVEVALAGEMDVPLALITGDSEGIREAQELLGDISVVIVKESKSESKAICYPCEETSRRIREAVPLSLDSLLHKELRPFTFCPPITLKVCLREGEVLKAIKKHFPESVLEKKTLCFAGDSVREVWQRYREMREGNNLFL